MALLARFIRFLFWIVVVTWGFRLAGRFLSRMLQSGQPEPLGSARDLRAHTSKGAHVLVRDPVCGVHISEGLAIPLHENGELLHFCSPACRDTYLNSSRTLAANG
jgi:hypothetical protein